MNPGSETFDCVLCACKHLAKARVLLDETKLGYAANFFIVLANLSLAEDHLVNQYPAQAELIRRHRKELEAAPTYEIPWEDLIMTTALLEGYDVSVLWPRKEETP